MRSPALGTAFVLSLFAYACGGVAPTIPDLDAAFGDAGVDDDAGVLDASARDDASVQDADIVSDAGTAPVNDAGSTGTTPDASATPSDAGSGPVDATVPPPVDAGTPRPDAGPRDAGAPVDAGSPSVDAGVGTIDASVGTIDASVGTIDAGVGAIDAGTGLGARVVFAHASPNYGSFGLCIGISGIPFVADTVKFPNLQAASGANFLQNLDNGTVSGAINQAQGFSSVVAYDQLTNASLQNAKIEYWGIKNATAGTSCRTLVGFNPLSPNSGTRKLGEIPYASLKSGGGYVAAVTGCVTSGGTKSGNTNLCGPDYGSNSPNLRLSVVQVPSGPVASGSIGASFVHLSSSSASDGLASATLKFLASGGGTSQCRYRVSTIASTSYLAASPLPNTAFGGGTLLNVSDISPQAQFGVEVGNNNGNVCGSIAAMTATLTATLSGGSDTTYFTSQAGKHMVFLLIGDANFDSPSNGGSWTNPWVRILAFPASP